jgi:3'-5' exoribonuclease
MGSRSIPLLTLAELKPGQEADVFVLLTAKEELVTRDGKPYLRVSFRDATREIGFPIWPEHLLAEDCRRAWKAGSFYKIRAIYRETHYGPQLDIQRIREIAAEDEADGFDPAMCRPQSRFDVAQLFAQLLEIAEAQIRHPGLRGLVVDLLSEHRAALCELPAAERNHHVYAGGWLEHTVCTTITAIFLADRYAAQYPDLDPPLNRDLVVAGALIHDIGKVRELRPTPTGAETTAAGHLVGHLVQGRDLIREAAAGREIEPELLLGLEHLMLAHHATPDYGSPKPPMTPEALLIHYADDLDARFHMMYVALRDDPSSGVVTSKKNVLGRSVYRGEK